MKIDPVFVLAPRPKPASMPTRRAFLIAGGAFVAGGTIGGACGYSMGAASVGSSTDTTTSAVPAASAAEVDLKSSGDAELDYWRKLAVQAPLDELFAKAPNFLQARVSTYRADEVLWRGVARMANEIIENPERRMPDSVVGLIIGQIEGPAHPAQPALRDLVPQLRARQQQLRRQNK